MITKEYTSNKELYYLIIGIEMCIYSITRHTNWTQVFNPQLQAYLVPNKLKGQISKQIHSWKTPTDETIGDRSSKTNTLVPNSRIISRLSTYTKWANAKPYVSK